MLLKPLLKAAFNPVKVFLKRFHIFCVLVRVRIGCYRYDSLHPFVNRTHVVFCGFFFAVVFFLSSGQLSGIILGNGGLNTS